MSSGKRIEWLHSVPALVGVSLGVIYGLGAISIYGQLKVANLNAVQAMGLVPIEEILGRGIGGMVSQFSQAFVMVALMFLIVFGTAGVTPTESEAQTSPAGNNKVTRGLDRFYSSPKLYFSILSVVVALMLAGEQMKVSLAYVIGIAFGAWSFSWMWAYTQRRSEHGARRIASVYIVSGLTFLIAFNISISFLHPPPLPHVRLAMADGSQLEGGLITHSSGSWYVAQSNHSILTVNARKVRRSFITYPKPSPEQSLIDWLWERPPSYPLGGRREE